MVPPGAYPPAMARERPPVCAANLLDEPDCPSPSLYLRPGDTARLPPLSSTRRANACTGSDRKDRGFRVNPAHSIASSNACLPWTTGVSGSHSSLAATRSDPLCSAPAKDSIERSHIDATAGHDQALHGSLHIGPTVGSEFPHDALLDLVPAPRGHCIRGPATVGKREGPRNLSPLPAFGNRNPFVPDQRRERVVQACAFKHKLGCQGFKRRRGV